MANNENENEDSINLDILLIGKLSVGKSSMICRFLDVPLEEKETGPHRGPDVTVISVDGVKCIIKIRENNPDDCDNLLESAKGTMLIYEIDDKDSFEDIKKCYNNKIKKLNNKACILVGNKLDLESERKVTKNEAEEFANENELSFLEISAIDNVNVKEAFMRIVHETLQKRQELLSKKNSNFLEKCCKCILV